MEDINQQNPLTQCIALFKRLDFDYLTSHNLNQTIDELRRLGLLASILTFHCDNQLCPYFGSQLKEVKDSSRMDSLFYKCEGCKQKHNLKRNSIFEGVQQPLVKYYRAIFLSFLQNMSISKAMLFCDMKESSMKCVYRYLKKQISATIQSQVEETVLCEIAQNQNQGEMEVEVQIPSCEIDESLFTHLRGVENVYDSQVWIVGIIQRQTNQIVCRVIGNQSQKTSEVMRNLITTYVATNNQHPTKIYTDGASCYNFLRNAGYEHHVVTHDQGFGQGEETTNHVESLWSQLKSIGRFNRGLNFDRLDQVQEAVDETVWRLQNKDNLNIKQDLANILINQYNLGESKVIEYY